MRKYGLYIGLLLQSVFLWSQADSASTTEKSVYTLDDCIQYAFEHQQDVINAQYDVENSIAQKKEVIGMGLPQITGQMQTMTNTELKQQYLPAGAFPDPNNPNQDPSEAVGVGFGVKSTNDITFNAKQLLFDGSYLAGVKASKVYVQLFEKSKVQTKVEVVESVTKAYCGVLVSKRRVEVLRTDSSNLVELIKDTRARYEGGFAENIDVLRLEVQLNNILIELENLISFQDISYKILKFQMGMDVNSKLSVTGNLEEVFRVATAIELPEADPEVRIEYQVLEAGRRVNEIDIQNKQADGLPKLYLFGAYGFNTGTNSNGDLFNPNKYSDFSLVGLTLDVPIFQGFAKNRRVDQARIALKKKEQDIEKFKLSVGLEVAQAEADFKVNMKKIEFHQKNIELAKTVYESAQIKFEAGTGSNFEVTDAYSDYADAQTNYYIAIYDAMLSFVELEKALGILYKEDQD